MSTVYDRLKEAALVLENDRTFYEAYIKTADSAASTVRILIRDQIKRIAGRDYTTVPWAWETTTPNAERREALRLYFDDRYDMERQRPVSTTEKPVPWPSNWGNPLYHRAAVSQPFVTEKSADPSEPKPGYFGEPAPCAVEGAHADLTQAMRSCLDDRVGAATAAMNAALVHYGTSPTPIADAITANPQLKETTMSFTHTNIIKIETLTLVNGVNLKSMTNAAIYDLIAQQEAKIAALEAIKTKPVMLKREIAERQAGVDALVAYLDSQESAPAKADAPKADAPKADAPTKAD